jgi:hypothetical protein
MYAQWSSICVIPGVPTGVSAAAQSSSSIRIQWNTVIGATRYNIYRSNTATGTFTFINSTTSTSFTDIGLPASTMRFYRVSAENACGESSMSSSVSTTTSPNTPIVQTGTVIVENHSRFTLSGLVLLANPIGDSFWLFSHIRENSPNPQLSPGFSMTIRNVPARTYSQGWRVDRWAETGFRTYLPFVVPANGTVRIMIFDTDFR